MFDDPYAANAALWQQVSGLGPPPLPGPTPTVGPLQIATVADRRAYWYSALFLDVAEACKREARYYRANGYPLPPGRLQLYAAHGLDFGDVEA